MKQSSSESPATTEHQEPPSKKRGFGWWVSRILLSLLVFAFIIFVLVTTTLRGSLPQLDGQLVVNGLSQTVTVTRDVEGVPTIAATDRQDLAIALGILHAQERFFQMDLLRRSAAGELSVLFGGLSRSYDQAIRKLRARHLARRIITELPKEERALLESYVLGVNNGVAVLKQKPFEYYVLQIDPQPWQPEDTILVNFAMYMDLQLDWGNTERALGAMQAFLPSEYTDFLAPVGSDTDAAIDGSTTSLVAIPTSMTKSANTDAVPNDDGFPPSENNPGSNNWAVGGALTAHGGGLLANDMHLGLNLPHIWFRARMQYTDPLDPSQIRDLIGVTLPGTPMLVTGSNRHIAWGYTNSYGDWLDLVVVEPDPQNPDQYLTPNGPQAFIEHAETIEIKGEGNSEEIYRWTIWGPIIGKNHQGKELAMRWVGLEPAGTNLALLGMEGLHTVEAALEQANHLGIPAQNFVVVDREGAVGWTIGGKIPKRFGGDGRTPQSWHTGAYGWDGWLEPENYPRILNPPNHRIWTANSRVVGGSLLEPIGDGGYAYGYRARQIRDRLLAKQQFDEGDFLAIQLDDEAKLMQLWRTRLLKALDDTATTDQPLRDQAKNLLRDWQGHAAIDSVAYRILRRCSSNTINELAGDLVSPVVEQWPDLKLRHLPSLRTAVWRLLEEQPAHLLPSAYKSWDAVLLKALDQTLSEMTADNTPLEQATWGKVNTSRIEHPMAGSLSILGDYLRAKPRPLPGGTFVPRVQSRGFGASQRMVVAPGREDQGIFHMPGGQSGHPLSPYFLAGHKAWEKGEATPLLPGETKYTLELQPQPQGSDK